MTNNLFKKQNLFFLANKWRFWKLHGTDKIVVWDAKNEFLAIISDKITENFTLENIEKAENLKNLLWLSKV